MSLKNQLSMLDVKVLASDAYRPLNTLQDYPAAYQVATLALGFKLLCEEYSLNVRETLEYIDRVIHDADRKEIHQVRAMRDYIRGELL